MRKPRKIFFAGKCEGIPLGNVNLVGRIILQYKPYIEEILF
jgi:hypothetical protein